MEKFFGLSETPGTCLLCFPQVVEKDRSNDLRKPSGKELDYGIFGVPWDKWLFPNIGVAPPNHSILIGFSIINHPFWGTPNFGNTQMEKNPNEMRGREFDGSGWRVLGEKGIFVSEVLFNGGASIFMHLHFKLLGWLAWKLVTSKLSCFISPIYRTKSSYLEGLASIYYQWLLIKYKLQYYHTLRIQKPIPKSNRFCQVSDPQILIAFLSLGCTLILRATCR